MAPDIKGVVAGGTKVQGTERRIERHRRADRDARRQRDFSETTANRTIKIDKDGNFSTFLENTGGANGLSFDSEGRLVCDPRAVGRNENLDHLSGSRKKVLVDNYDGKPFGRANDLTVAKNGGVLTDSANATPMPPGGLPLPAAFYYLPPRATKAIQILSDVAFPNGVILSRDEKTLYLNNTNGEYLLAFDVQPDGSLKKKPAQLRELRRRHDQRGRVPVSGADGMTLDNQGRLYVAAANGVQVFSPQGQHLGTIPMPRPPQNLAFAGPDKKTLYVVGRGVASKVQMIAQGSKIAQNRDMKIAARAGLLIAAALTAVSCNSTTAAKSAPYSAKSSRRKDR